MKKTVKHKAGRYQVNVSHTGTVSPVCAGGVNNSLAIDKKTKHRLEAKPTSLSNSINQSLVN